ncbi:MAG TPA: hypothetical protein PKD24_04385 [Pyrinomonadaceae bacterium]|nr:hypothetical protein [Pyrinomonadaceae bacterium]HMP64788.1 hypothetical protein [Pyrinomonadaceae bacterium]
MDILNSGSFVPLDNKERMEQLAFTAKTLAIEVSRAEGFQSNGPTNHQLGLEMWKGAEYLCRAHEEATIRNLFLSKFLETLREIERQCVVQPKPPQTQIVNTPTVNQPEPMPVLVQPPSTQVVADARPQEVDYDEYLGVVQQDIGIETERPSYADECVPEGEAEIAALNDNAERDELIPKAESSREDEPKESTSLEVQEPEEPVAKDAGKPDVSEIRKSEDRAAAIEIASKDTAEVERPGSPDEPIAPIAEDADIAGSPVPDAAPAIGSIELPDREPFDFNACTVTAVIQLLPEKEGGRKCVVSVRSHDFAPQISISELSSGGLNDGLKDCLETSLGQYKANLPVLSAEKLKKQKAASKKRTSKTDAKSAKSGPSSKSEAAAATTPPATQNAETAKDQQGLFAS